ncbi:hypothetical protein P691DRAFT_770043 [Macrolepiota fuliginosa MF-IS2]|uniref:FAD/NAD(P)-binding domain-containing protein n=1 Tax=Macrolepiota fuliginosa MF-IS2 TaxID=1400762 RepID=A0A9P6C7L9_9AGAR|nr:hypothetical protein P691DRAFT_770043 [Macrolepiota fuliginosa MF-IS2]
MARTVKVAIIGSGLAGLTSAWLLTRPLKTKDVEFEVHVFEKTDVLGMDAASVSLTNSQPKKQWRIDVPLRAFQEGYYPQLIAMYKRLDIKMRQANFSYSYSFFSPPGPHQKRKITTTFIYNGLSGRTSFGMPSYLVDTPQFPQSSIFGKLFTELWTWVVFILMTLEILFCFFIFVLYSVPFFRSPSAENQPFKEWAKEVTPNSFLARWVGLDIAWQSYVRDIIVPMLSGVCTATEDDVLDYPAELFLDFIWLTIGTHHYVLANGVREAVAQLSKDLKHIHVSAPITSVTMDPGAPHLASLTCATALGGQETFHGFHHVIFATEANTAASILSGYASGIQASSGVTTRTFKHSLLEQAEALSTFRYRTAVVVNHTDDTLLPDDPRDHRDLNFIHYRGTELGSPEKDPKRDSSVCVSSSYTMVTHTLPRPEGYPTHQPTVYQTTNPYIPPKKDSILSVARLERAVPTVEAKKALQNFCQQKERKWWECSAIASTRLGPLQGAGRMTGGGHPGIWICGSYASPGIPLLEGCVVSAKDVVVEGILACEGTGLREEPWVA